MSVRNPPSFHVHPASLDTGSTIESFVEREKELGTGALTVTDHGSLSACRKVYDLAQAEGLTAQIGLESYLKDPKCPILTSFGQDPETYCKYFHVTMLFLDQKAFETASRIISTCPYEKHGSEAKPLFNWGHFEELGAQNTIIFSGCLIGATQRHLLEHNRPDIAEQYYLRLKGCAKPGNFYTELFPHVCDSNWVSGLFIEINEGDKISRLKFHLKKKLRTNAGETDAETLLREFNRKDNKHVTLDAIKDYSKWNEREPAKILKVEFLEDYFKNPCTPEAPDGDVQRWGNEFVLGLAKKYNVPCLFSDDAHFATPDAKVVQDVRLMSGGGSWRFANSYHRQSGQEQWDYFNNRMTISRGEFDSWVDNAFALSNRFKAFKFDYKPELPSKFFPKDTLGHLKTLIQKHGRMRWDDERYRKRLEEEVNLFYRNGIVDLLPYFFFCEEACDLYKKNNLLTGVGRGSSAGTILAYLLGITHADPLRHGLSLERFLTLDRIKAGTFPDIDMDFSNRDLLVGGTQEVIECTLEDGTTKEFLRGQTVRTEAGVRKIEDAIAEGLEICE